MMGIVHIVNQEKPMDTNQQTNERITQSIRFEPVLHAAITKLMVADARPSVANTVEWLLKTHPKVQEILEAESVGVSA